MNFQGKEFGEDFYLRLKEGDTALDSLPGSKAINIINKIDNKSSFRYLKALQKEFFVNGKNMNDVNIYAKIAKELGVRSYPSLVMVVNEETSLISSGYLPFEEVRALIKKNY